MVYKYRLKVVLLLLLIVENSLTCTLLYLDQGDGDPGVQNVTPPRSERMRVRSRRVHLVGSMGSRYGVQAGKAPKRSWGRVQENSESCATV